MNIKNNKLKRGSQLVASFVFKALKSYKCFCVNLAFQLGHGNKLLENVVVTVIKQVQNGKKLEDQIALIYKGEAIVIANKSNFSKATKTILKNLSNEKKFLEVCEELYKKTPKIEGKFWVWENHLGTKLRKSYNSEKSLLNNIKVAIEKTNLELKEVK